ncbi:hypothetical protein HCC61_02470 [Streptomyces sp. HNM0575]|uniref:hypothetical protein n=1 Tax=Streptomyces sp. HNM0575 TaxID=2716338 RepID=UPI00145DD4CE|nr:hypothetical protein [Streptomyces sp. HNM0575]NLU71563.1 hypothetical protein [Streptomyces sp. HNM0575]
MDGRADSQGRVYQSSGDQHITEHHHHREPVAFIEEFGGGGHEAAAGSQDGSD